MIAYDILPEKGTFSPDIHALHELAFGPGRYARAAFRLREQGPHDPELSFVAVMEGRMAGTVRQTWVTCGHGGAMGLLLGPLAVLPELKNAGIGKALVRKCTSAAADAGAKFVLLVGDAPYYGPLGFAQVPARQLALPGPVDPARLLVHLIGSTEMEEMKGMVMHAHPHD